MKFHITLHLERASNNIIPINYQYPLSAAIYKIISKGDIEYANFLHQTGYGKKGMKLFTFSQLNVPFKIKDDRLILLNDEVNLDVSFHLPEAMESFVKGLFQSEQIDIADKKSKASFTIKSVESIPNLLQSFKENEIVNIQLQPVSPLVVGTQNEKGNYDFLSPEAPLYTESLIYNWRTKIATCFDEQTAIGALLMIEVFYSKNPPKSRLITIKADTPEQTKIRGWMNFELQATGEKRFMDLLLNAGCGVYNSMGMGCVEVIN